MLHSINARTGEVFGAQVPTSTGAELETAIQKAHHAYSDWQASDGETRAKLLNTLADAIEADREKLVEMADVETGLGLLRLNGELDRTVVCVRPSHIDLR